MFDQIPVDVLEQHEGQWIVWDQDDQCVVAAADSIDEAEDQVRLNTAQAGHLLRVHRVLPRNTDIAGMV